MKRRTAFVSILVAVLVGLAGTLGCSRLSPSGNVSLAEAARQSETAYKDIQTYRYSMKLVQGPQPMRDVRNLFQQREGTIELTVVGEVQKPDRVSFEMEKYHIYGPEERVESFDGCGVANIYIGTKGYARQCDGSWTSRDINAPSMQDTVGEYWSTLQSLTTTTRLGTDTLRGIAVTVFAGEFLQDGVDHTVTVKVGEADGLVRYIKDESPGKSLELERWDINDPAIRIEAPLP